MHSAERDKLILEYLGERGFISFKALERRVRASPATIRRDLERLTMAGLITRVHGGARLAGGAEEGNGASRGCRISQASRLTRTFSATARRRRRSGARRRNSVVPERP